jgi:hypothetical protein
MTSSGLLMSYCFFVAVCAIAAPTMSDTPTNSAFATLLAVFIGFLLVMLPEICPDNFWKITLKHRGLQ